MSGYTAGQRADFSTLPFCPAGIPENDKLLIIPFLHALPEAEGLAHQFDNMSMMGETIQESSLKFLISRDLYPVSALEICSDDERQSFVKFLAEGVQRLN